jgi:voltage-gated potassium channel
VTTVGYGDVNPVTGEGRAIALILMLVGVGVISIFTASVASFFVGDDKQELQQVEERLKSLEGHVDELLKELKRVRSFEYERSS